MNVFKMGFLGTIGVVCALTTMHMVAGGLIYLGEKMRDLASEE